MDRDDVDAEEDEIEEDPGLDYRLLIVVGLGSVLALLVLPILVVLLLKLARRRRRRWRGSSSRRVAAGWQEMVDHARDLGLPTGTASTRREEARALETALAEGTAVGRRHRSRQLRPVDPSELDGTALAAHADAGVFGPVVPDEDAVSGYWRHLEHTVARLRRAVGRRRWLRSRISVRSLRKGR